MRDDSRKSASEKKAESASASLCRPLQHYDAAVQQDRPQMVDQRSALRHLMRAGPVQSLEADGASPLTGTKHMVRRVAAFAIALAS
ncbi:MAG: hypothetical protein EOQ69_28830 [Mesorhizobium sp.]|nr:MAG: hypothetical protein EOQ69_28830 [Mesorhizobium sp.]